MSDERLHEDELVSAYLDGEATPAEIAEVEASDALLARVEEFRAVRDAVAEPVTPLPAGLRNDLIGAALGVADAEAATRLEAEVVPPRGPAGRQANPFQAGGAVARAARERSEQERALRRPQRLLLAMAAAVIVLAAVVGTGLITSRGGDDYADTAAEASAPADASAEMAAEAMAAEAMTEAAPTAEAEPMPEMDMAAPEEAMAEEAPAEEAALAEVQAETATQAAETTADELARLADEEAAPTQEAPAATTTVAAATAAGTDDGDGSPAAQVVDLGTLESLESLFEAIGASWSAALEDGAMADSGECAEAVQERALALSAETARSFVASVGTEDPVTFDAGFALRDDGTAVIVYAAPPDCEIGVHELPGS